MKYLLFYEPAENVLEKAAAHFPAHSARLDEFRQRRDRELEHSGVGRGALSPKELARPAAQGTDHPGHSTCRSALSSRSVAAGFLIVART